ncbi:MAG: hypothetical protein K8R89_03615 [Anaerolineae bacterium]|nr:hypothetical protein [Anaerolineae bacterium]
MRSLVGAVVEVQGAGQALVLRVHIDDSVRVLFKSGIKARVNKDYVSLLPVNEQSEAWIAQHLLGSWQIPMQQFAQYIAHRINSMRSAEIAEMEFRKCLNIVSIVVDNGKEISR